MRAPGAAAWVLYKLDGGIDHILVDEAQDTSPAQWADRRALAEEFFAGAAQRERLRTLFAVGDEKQSIYSFQGAAPARFAEMGRAFQRRGRGGALAWRDVPLNLSFRATEPLLAAVDARLRRARSRAPGSSSADDRGHPASRLPAGQAGLVEIWPR